MDYHRNIKALFWPKSVAIVGASTHAGKIGNIIVGNLLQAGFDGKILPVNPKADTICGLPAYKDIADLPAPLDMAVICIPPKFVVQSMEALAQLPTKAAIIITAGFKEVGKDGYYLEEQVKKIAKEHDIALLGPNCLGLINPPSGVNASFAVGQPQPGNIAFFSQSGALCVSILDWALGYNIGFSKFISLGNKAVLGEAEMLALLAEDEHTKVILGYVEGVDNGKRFMNVARQVSKIKPVIMIKSGTTSAGAKAASSHTGAIAGSDSAYTAAFKQSGIIRCHDVASLFNLAAAFSTQPLPKGPNLAIITNSGGPGILAADATDKTDLMLARISPSTIEKTHGVPAALRLTVQPHRHHWGCTGGTLCQDSGDHPPGRTRPLRPDAALAHRLGPARGNCAGRHRVRQKDGQADFRLLHGRESRGARPKRMLQDAGIPCYGYPEPAIHAMDTMYKYFERTKRPDPVEVCYRRDLGRAEQIIKEARDQGWGEIVEFQAQGLLKAYELPLPQTRLARTSDEAVKTAERIGFPVVLKIASPQISHKSDVDGVKVNLRTPEEVAHPPF